MGTEEPWQVFEQRCSVTLTLHGAGSQRLSTGNFLPRSSVPGSTIPEGHTFATSSSACFLGTSWALGHVISKLGDPRELRWPRPQV